MRFDVRSDELRAIRDAGMRLPAAMSFSLEFEARLAEEAVLRVVVGQACEAEFRRERDPIYEIADAEAREERFRDLHVAWFERLGLGAPLEQALAEQPSIEARTRGARVLGAASRRAEGADLQVERRQTPLLVVRLRPTTLVDAEAARRLLRRELLHVADMLDPVFGYDAAPPVSDGGPVLDGLHIERYRVLWDAWTSGRMQRRGWLDAGGRERSLAAFTTTFPGPDVERRFARWFDAGQLSHAELLDFARSPDLG